VCIGVYGEVGGTPKLPSFLGIRAPGCTLCTWGVVALVLEVVHYLACFVTEPYGARYPLQGTWPIGTKPTGANRWQRLAASLAPGWYGPESGQTRSTNEGIRSRGSDGSTARNARIGKQQTLQRDKCFHRRPSSRSIAALITSRGGLASGKNRLNA
jgi:hypothetical protein